MERRANSGFLHLVQEVGDSAPAAWLQARIDVPAVQETIVGTVAPRGFAAYARVLHPAYRSDPSAPDGRVPVRWGEVARWSRRAAHAEMQWEAIAAPPPGGAQPPPWTEAPLVGRIPAEVRLRLVDILLRHTQAPEPCWLCFWDGFADVQRFFARPPRVHLPTRSYHLGRAPLASLGVDAPALDFRLRDMTPSLWWPQDRAWCVATEVDLSCTYVGASPECIADLLGDPSLEAMPAELSHRADSRGDAINALS